MTGSTWRSTVVYSPGPHLSEEYWKLRTYGTIGTLVEAMQSRGFRCRDRGRMNKDRALELDLRSQRGLLSYETLSRDELRTFCAQRGIVVRGNPLHSVVKKLLEQADDNATFDRFTELPAELRLQIFELYVPTLPEHGRPLTAASKQPPVTLASQLLRNEALPIFYNQTLFQFDICESSSSARRPTPRSPCWLSIDTARFVERMDNNTIGHMRRLEMRLVPFFHSWESLCRFIIDLNTGTYSVETSFRKKADDAVEQSITEVFEEIIARKVPQELRKEDFHSLCAAVDRASAKVGGFFEE